MAERHGVSHDTVQKIWSGRGIKPHRVKKFKLSTDKRFEEKLIDIVGVYLNPPKRAVVLCVDEKSQTRPWIARSPACRSSQGVPEQ